MKWNFDKLVAECRRLRQEADEAEARLMAFLWRIENTPELLAMVEESGQAFERFVERTVLVRFSRYRQFCAGFTRLGSADETAVSVGTEAVIASRNVVTTAKLPEYVTAIGAWVEEHGGARPSREASERIASQVDPRAKTPQAIVRKTKLAEAEEEARKLRARVRELEAENRALKAKIERLSSKSAKGGSGRGGARKPAAKAAEAQAI